MFVRKINHPNGYTYVQVIDKSNGKYKVIKNLGRSKDATEIKELQLWQVEKAFRITKTDLKIIPIYHRLPERIEAHICLNFVAYKIFKELERQLQERNATISTAKAIEIAKHIFQVKAVTKKTKETVNKIVIFNEEQKYLYQLFNFGG